MAISSNSAIPMLLINKYLQESLGMLRISRDKVSGGTPAATAFTQPRLGCRVPVASANAPASPRQVKRGRTPTLDARYNVRSSNQFGRDGHKTCQATCWIYCRFDVTGVAHFHLILDNLEDADRVSARLWVLISGEMPISGSACTHCGCCLQSSESVLGVHVPGA